MDYNQFMAKVQQYTGLPKEDALKVVEAVLETLGERLSKKHREHLAAQLAGELRPFALKHAKTELFSLDAFYQSVAKRARLPFHDAIKQARAVGQVTAQALAEGELRDIFSELPTEFDELVGWTPTRITPTTVNTHELFKK